MIKLKNRALGAIGKHANRAGARWKCTPSAYGTSPRESVSRNFQSPYGSLQISFACHPGGGGLLSAQPCANLSRSSYSNGKSSPFGGKVVPKVPKGVHFLAPKARLFGFPARRAVCLFSHGRSPVVWVSTNWRRSRPPQPSRPRAVSILRTLGAKAPSIFRTLTPKGRVHKATHLHLPFTIYNFSTNGTHTHRRNT